MSNILDKLLNIDRHIIYLMIAIVVTAPILSPLGLPLPVSKSTTEVYEYLKNLPPGSVVLFHNGGSEGQWAYGAPDLVVIGRHILELPVKVIFVSFHYAGPTNTEKLLQLIGIGAKEYGVDYVNLGFIPGYPQPEPSLAAFGRDIHSICPVDYYGNPINDLPLMKNVKTSADIDVIIDLGGIATGEMFVKQWAGVPVIGIWAPSYTATMAAYYEEGSVVGILVGIRGTAEYEFLTKHPGQAIVMQDAISIYHVLFVALLMVGNVAFLLKKFRRSQ